jgi:hypothetical protein
MLRLLAILLVICIYSTSNFAKVVELDSDYCDWYFSIGKNKKQYMAIVPGSNINDLICNKIIPLGSLARDHYRQKHPETLVSDASDMSLVGPIFLYSGTFKSKECALVKLDYLETFPGAKFSVPGGPGRNGRQRFVCNYARTVLLRKL